MKTQVNMELDEIISALRKLPDKEFVEVFYESAQGRNI